MRERAIALVFIASGWAITLATPAILSSFEHRIATGPNLPYLLNYSQGMGCVRSSPVHLMVVVGMAVLGVVVAEIAKLARPARWLVVSVLAFQLVLVADCIRAYARDWWSYFVIVGSGHNIEQLTWMDPPPVSAVTWPWISASVGALIAVALLATGRKVPAN